MGNSVVPVQSAQTIGQKIVDITKSFAMPVGTGLIFLGVVMIAIQLIISHNNPRKREEVIGGIPYLAIGSIVLGAAMTIAGFLIGLGQ